LVPLDVGALDLEDPARFNRILAPSILVSTVVGEVLQQAAGGRLA
jgi:hypothetical protein